eukprot:9469569-Pyramimonas_sp.AAC.1
MFTIVVITTIITTIAIITIINITNNTISPLSSLSRRSPHLPCIIIIAHTCARLEKTQVGASSVKEFLTLRVSPPAHPVTMPKRMEVIREVREHTE